MKKLLLLALMVLGFSISYAQEFAIVKTTPAATVKLDPAKATWNMWVTYQGESEFMKDANGKRIKYEVDMLNKMSKDGWELFDIATTHTPTSAGSLNYTYFYFRKKE